MRQFAPLATSPRNRPFSRRGNRVGSQFERTPRQRLRLLPSRMHHQRMASETPAPPTMSLRHARCLFHPLREAAARCPHCGGTFCRECVTDEDGKLACPPCLRRIARPPAPKRSLTRQLRQVLAGFAALAFLVALFFAMLQWRVNTPEEHLNLGRIASGRLSEQNRE